MDHVRVLLDRSAAGVVRRQLDGVRVRVGDAGGILEVAPPPGRGAPPTVERPR